MGYISSLKFVFILSVCSLACTARAEIDSLIIQAFGDSITQGFARDADGEIGGILDPPRGARIDWWGYEIELEYMIEASLGSGTSSIYNWGAHGLRSDSALTCGQAGWDCIDVVLDSREEANMILIMLGANDLYNGISSPTTQSNLSEMIDKSRAQGVTPVLGTITPNSSGDIDPALINDAYNPMIRELAEEKKVPLAEHYETMDENWASHYTSGDGLHLSEDGNYKLAQNWHKAIMKYLTDPDPEPVIISPILHLLLNDS